ncbi:Bardet-Biedl syndrome 1 [Carabus blaptoides fortunei]
MQSLLDLLPSNKKMTGDHTRWLNAHVDRGAGVHTLGQCVAMCDLSGTGDHGLVIAEPQPLAAHPNSNARSRMRVYRGTAALWCDQPLQEVPSAVVSFYTDELEPRVPAVAVSCGVDILIYKNTKPYYKFTLPTLPVVALEHDIWHQLSESYDPHSIADKLRLLKTIPYAELSPRTQQLLTLPAEQIEDFIGRYVNAEPMKTSVITCMATLNRNSKNKDAVACLVVATEAGHVYFLDPQGFSILHQASVSTTGTSRPSIIACSGMFDVEFRCVLACRDGTVCLLRRDWLEGKVLLQTSNTIVDMVLLASDNFITLATCDKQLACYTKRGKKLWTVQLPGPATCMAQVPLPHLNTCLVAVGLGGGAPLQLYQGRQLVDTIHLPESASAVIFGQLGQEENVLVIVTQAGSLVFKILKRTADFNSSVLQDNHPHSYGSNKSLPLPKRSKLFAEQAQRERQHAQAIHQTFQQDLIRLRLQVGRATVQAHKMADQSVSDNAKHPVKLSAQVLGLGPKFTLTLMLENLSNEKSVGNLSLVLHAQIQKYQIGLPFINVPLIPPELQYKMEVPVTEILSDNDFSNNNSDTIPIKVFVITAGQAQPILAATINMPPTDPLAFL